MFKPDQFRSLIKDTLMDLAEGSGIPGLYSENAVELLMLTAAQESHLGKYLEQISGPAKGVFQIEPGTHMDLYANFLSYKPQLRSIAESFLGSRPGITMSLRSNLAYAIVIARLIYFRNSEPLPSCKDVAAMARFWKKHYNTHLGKGTVEEAVNNYKRHVLEEDI